MIFNLRPEATFSDGTPMTAEDVMFTYDLLIERGSPPTVMLRDIAAVEVLDTDRVKFTFTPGRAGARPPSSPAGCRSCRRPGSTTVPRSTHSSAVPPGLGPYVVARRAAGSLDPLLRNPDYWGKDLPINVGRNNFDTSASSTSPTATAAFEAFKAGEYTFR